METNNLKNKDKALRIGKKLCDKKQRAKKHW